MHWHLRWHLRWQIWFPFRFALQIALQFDFFALAFRILSNPRVLVSRRCRIGVPNCVMHSGDVDARPLRVLERQMLGLGEHLLLPLLGLEVLLGQLPTLVQHLLEVLIVLTVVVALVALGLLVVVVARADGLGFLKGAASRFKTRSGAWT